MQIRKPHIIIALKRIFRVCVALSAITIIWLLLGKKLEGISGEQVFDSIASVPKSAIFISICAVVISYFGVSFYDKLSLRLMNKDVSWRRSIFSSISTYSIARVLGAPLVTGNAARLWWFSKWDLGVRDVVSVTLSTMVFTNITTALLVAIFLLGIPSETLDALLAMITPFISIGWLTLAGVAFGVSAFILVYIFGTRLVTYFMETSRAQHIAAGQFLLVTSIDYIASALVLFALIYHLGLTSFPVLFVLFTLGSLVGAASNIPSGLGVLEATLLVSLPAGYETEIISACLLYRLIYDAIPFTLSLLIIGLSELFMSHRRN